MSAYSLGFDIFAKDRASSVFDRLSKKMGFTGKHAETMSKAMVAGLATAGVAVVGFAKSSVSAYVDAEKQQRVLTDAYQRFPALANVPLQALRDQAQALQSVTKFDGDATAAAMGHLAAFKLTGTQVEQLTPLMLDYAAKTGRDLPSAASVLGKAILGNGRALKDVGLNFKDTGSKAGNLDQLMGGLRTQVGGFATKEGKSAEGQSAILANKFGDLKEAVGSQLLPALQGLTTAGIKVLDWLQANPAALMAVKAALVVVAAAMVVATGAWVALNMAFVATPIGAIITGLVLLGVGLVVLYKKSETFRNIVQIAFDGVKIAAIGMALQAVQAFRFLLGFWLVVAAGIVHGAALAFGWVPGLGPKLKAADRAVSGFKDSVNATLARVQKKLEIQLQTAQAEQKAHALARTLSAIKSRSIYIAIHYTMTAGRIWDGKRWVNPGLRAGGGPIRKGQPYIVGERGPELIFARGDGQVMDAKTSAVAMAGGNARGLTTGGGGEVHYQPIILQGPDGSVLWRILAKYGREIGFQIVPV